MINNLKKKSRAVTLVELLIAVFLLSLVVMTAVTVELSVRKMQTTPTAQAKNLNELMPAMEKIKKDYARQIGDLDNQSVFIKNSGRRLEIRVDDSAPWGQLNSGDNWYAYLWNNTAGDPLEYYNNTTNTFLGSIAQGISYFKVSAPTGNPTEALNIQIRKRLDPSKPEHPVDNPGMNLTTTFFARQASAN